MRWRWPGWDGNIVMKYVRRTEKSMSMAGSTSMQRIWLCLTEGRRASRRWDAPVDLGGSDAVARNMETVLELSPWYIDRIKTDLGMTEDDQKTMRFFWWELPEGPGEPDVSLSTSSAQFTRSETASS